MKKIEELTYQEIIETLCSNITVDNGDDIYSTIEEIYQLYKSKLTIEEIINTQFVLAQLDVMQEKDDETRKAFLSLFDQIETVTISDRLKSNIYMGYARFLSRKEEYNEAIIVLEKALSNLNVMIDNLPPTKREIYFDIIDILCSLYSIINEHQKSIDMGELLISFLFTSHFEKYGHRITLDNIDFDDKDLKKIISVYLGLGASSSRLNKYIEAREYLSLAYFISSARYGDSEECTLKLMYNLAVNEMIGIENEEGVRQLIYVYADMKKYLGDTNEYTKKAFDILSHLNDSNGNK